MIAAMRSVAFVTGWLVQRAMFAAIAILGIALGAYSVACALGYAPWLDMTATFGGYIYPQAGIVVQIAVSALAVGLCFFLPSNARIMALENSHRRFHIGMEDVARAYAAAHEEDRNGVFRLRSEFDSIRERIAFLRNHPDLEELEPNVLEVASQMSHISRELAHVYSERNVQRAKDFLLQRQQEIEEFNQRLDQAKGIAAEMRVWVDKVELEESVAEAQLARLCDELTAILPEIDLPDDEARAPSEIPRIGKAPEDASDWGEASPQDFGDDDRIVALLARRAAE